MKNLFVGSFSRSVEKFHPAKIARVGTSHAEMHRQMNLTIPFVIHALPGTELTFVKVIVMDA